MVKITPLVLLGLSATAMAAPQNRRQQGGRKGNGNGGGGNGQDLSTKVTQAKDGSMILQDTAVIDGLPLVYKISGPASAFKNLQGAANGQQQQAGNGQQGGNGQGNGQQRGNNGNGQGQQQQRGNGQQQQQQQGGNGQQQQRGNGQQQQRGNGQQKKGNGQQQKGNGQQQQQQQNGQNENGQNLNGGNGQDGGNANAQNGQNGQNGQNADQNANGQNNQNANDQNGQAAGNANDQNLGLNVLLHGDGGQSFFEFPNQGVQNGLMGMVILAPNKQRQWGGGGQDRPQGPEHSAAVNKLLQNVLPTVINNMNASNTFFTGVSGGSLMLSGDFLPAFASEYPGTGVMLMCGGNPPRNGQFKDAANVMKTMRVHFQTTTNELAQLKQSIPQTIAAYEKLGQQAGANTQQLQTVNGKPQGGHCEFDEKSFNSGIQLMANNYANVMFGNGDVNGIGNVNTPTSSNPNPFGNQGGNGNGKNGGGQQKKQQKQQKQQGGGNGGQQRQQGAGGNRQQGN